MSSQFHPIVGGVQINGLLYVWSASEVTRVDAFAPWRARRRPATEPTEDAIYLDPVDERDISCSPRLAG